jgi:hypothetical protein
LLPGSRKISGEEKRKKEERVLGRTVRVVGRAKASSTPLRVKLELELELGPKDPENQ